MILNSLIIFILIALSETLNGIARIRLLNRRLGNKRAKKVSLASGGIIILVITWNTLTWIGPNNLADTLLIGSFWLVLMLAYDVWIGRCVFRMSWQLILNDFDPRKGNLLAFGMLWIFLAPSTVYLLR